MGGKEGESEGGNRDRKEDGEEYYWVRDGDVGEGDGAKREE